MTDTPSVFSNNNIEILNIKPREHPEEYNGMTTAEIIAKKRKDHADYLLHDVSSDYYYKIAENAYSFLFDYLHEHDPDLFLVFTGDENLVEDHYFETNTGCLSYNGDCTMREKLYIGVLYGVCVFIQYYYNIDKDPLTRKDFEPFVRTLLGWSPIVYNQDGSKSPLPDHDKCVNKYSHFESEEDLNYAILEEIRFCNDLVNYEYSLKYYYPEHAETAKNMFEHFLANKNINYNDHKRPLVFGYITETKDKTQIREAICKKLVLIENKETPPLSDKEWDNYMAELSKVAYIAD